MNTPQLMVVADTENKRVNVSFEISAGLVTIKLGPESLAKFLSDLCEARQMILS